MPQMKSPERYTEEIHALGPQFDYLSALFRKDIGPNGEGVTHFDEFSADFWRRNTYGNALIRLRQLTENNFLVIETLGLLAVVRYIFELSVWLLLFEKDFRYCLVYYRELLKTQLRYHKDTAKHLEREIKLLNDFEAEEKLGHEKVRAENTSLPDASREMDLVSTLIDAQAARCFAIYLDEARSNGYGHQSHLVKNQAIPRTQAVIEELKQKILELEAGVSQDVQPFFSLKKWEWRGMSEKAGILQEYDYIYCYASKLLHATPVSITTDEKNLERVETCMFLRYILVKMLDIIHLSHSQPEACR